jgi:hypothetical protein
MAEDRVLYVRRKTFQEGSVNECVMQTFPNNDTFGTFKVKGFSLKENAEEYEKQIQSIQNNVCVVLENGIVKCCNAIQFTPETDVRVALAELIFSDHSVQTILQRDIKRIKISKV